MWSPLAIARATILVLLLALVFHFMLSNGDGYEWSLLIIGGLAGVAGLGASYMPDDTFVGKVPFI